jgi:DNA-binding MarR family transcriptional regulator
MTVGKDWMRAEEYQALAEFRYVLRCFLNFSEASARRASIEPQQHQLLLALKGLPPSQRPTIRVLADRLQLRHNSTVELVKRSIENGLLERRRSAQDGREVLLAITAHGTRVLRRLSIAHRDEVRSRVPALIQTLEVLVNTVSLAAPEVEKKPI